MKYEHILVELFVNQALRSKQIIDFLNKSTLSKNLPLLNSLFNKETLSFSDLYNLISSQIGEEESDAYIEGIELVNEYLLILSVSHTLLNDEEEVNENNKYSSTKGKISLSTWNDKGKDERRWNINTLKYLIEFGNNENENEIQINKSKSKLKSKDKYTENEYNTYNKHSHQHISEIFKFEFVNMIILYASMFSLIHNKKLLLFANMKFTIDSLFDEIDIDKDGLITNEDIEFLFNKHKVKISRKDINLIFQLNISTNKSLSRKNTIEKNINISDYFDYKSFKGYLYMFSIGNSNSNSHFKKERKESIEKNKKLDSHIKNKVLKGNYSANRLIEQFISLSNLEKSLDEAKIDYIEKGELSLIDIFTCFDIDNNDYISIDQFLSSLEFLGIYDNKIGILLFNSFSNNNKLSYLNFVEILLPSSPEKSIKLSRMSSRKNFSKTRFFKSDEYSISKLILKKIMNFQMSLHRNYLLIKENILVDKRFSIEEAFFEIFSYADERGKDDYYKKDGKNVKDESFDVERVFINENSISNYLITTSGVDVGYYIKEEYLAVVLCKINKMKSSKINLMMFMSFFKIYSYDNEVF